MGALEDYIRSQRVTPRTNPMRDSVMSRDSQSWQPEYESEPALEEVHPEDLIGGLAATRAAASALLKKAVKPASIPKSYSGRALTNLQPETLSHSDLQRIRELMNEQTKVGSQIDGLQRIIAGYIPEHAESYKDSVTRMFLDGGKPKAAYQLDVKPDSTYIPNLVSFERGLGHQALEDAYQQAKRLNPSKPVKLVSLPDTNTINFYRNQKPWVETIDDGISHFTRKAHGGLVQMRNK